jgi:PAS domain S-box-containing protein
MNSNNEKNRDKKINGENPASDPGLSHEFALPGKGDKNFDNEKQLIIDSQAEKIFESKSLIKNLNDEIQELKHKLELHVSLQEQMEFITGLITDFVFSIIVTGENKLELDWINKNFAKEMGFSFETLLDVEFSRNVLHHEDYSKFQDALIECMNGEKVYIEIRLLHGARNMIWHNFAFYPVIDENTSRVSKLYGACSNISQHRKKERELERLNDELNMLVKEKTFLFENTVNNLQDEINLRILAEKRLSELEERVKLTDITKTKAADEQLLILSSAVEQSSSGILITDINGIIEYINPKITLITGFEKEELIGQSPRIFNSGRQPKELYKNLWSTILSGLNWSGELENKKKSGEYYSEFITISPIKNDEGIIMHFLAVEEDITERKKIEAELLKSKKEAEEADRAKSFLIANISHELRTPLNAVLGFAQLLSDDVKNRESSKIIEKITISGKRLLHTLNLVLASTELESRDYQPDYKEIDLQFLCKNIKSAYESQAAEKNLKFELDLPLDKLKILSDEYLLSGIITNVVENAIKYTKTGLVRLELHNLIKYEGEDFTLINVKDTGIGIRKEDYEIIFREFRQVSEGFHRDFEGLGLGLSLAHRMAKLLNIKILVESEWQKGSNFSILIPQKTNFIPLNKKPVPIQEQTNNLPSTKSLLERHLKILLVEDNLLNIEVVELFLKKYWDISSVSNGEDAINFAKQSKYDLFLIDINLGHGMDGIEVLRQIKRINNYQETPSIAITGYASEKHKKIFLEQGFTNYLAKPFYKNELIGMIKQVVKMN